MQPRFIRTSFEMDDLTCIESYEKGNIESRLNDAFCG
jgi:hypothetical protein